MVGEWFEDVAVYFGSEGGWFGAELGGGGVGRDRKPRRGYGSACSARVDVFLAERWWVWRLPMGAPSASHSTAVRAMAMGVEGRGYVRCEASFDSGVGVGGLRRTWGVLHELAGDG